MKNLLTVSFLCSLISYSQTYFNNEFHVDTFSYHNSQEGYFSLLYDTNDTVIVVSGIGSTDSNPASLHIPYLAKFDLHGNMLDSGQIHFVNPDYKYGIGQPRSIIRERQSNYIIAGGLKEGVSDYNGFVFKVDPNLDTVWMRQFGDSAHYDFLNSCQMTRDLEYIVAGCTRTYSDYGPIDANMWLVKLDTSGNLLWQNNFGGNDYEWTATVDTTTDGGFILGGNSYSNSADRDVFVVKTDSLGNLEWQKWYNLSNKTDGGSIKSLSNGHFMVFGSSEYIDPNDPTEYAHHAFAMELDDLGNQVWYKEYGYFLPPHAFAYEYSEYFGAMDILSDGYIFLGQGYDPNQLHHTAFLLKTDFNGNELWKRRYFKRDTTYNYPRSMIVVDSSDIISCGRLGIKNFSQTQAGWLFKTNCDGFFQTPQADAVFNTASQIAIFLDNNSTYFTNGSIEWGDGTVSDFDESSDSLFNHTYDSSGTYTITLYATACNYTDTISFIVEPNPLYLNETKELEVLIYPNPAKGQLAVMTSIEEAYEIKMYNQTGKLVKRLLSSGGNTKLDLTNIENGFYVIQISNQKRQIIKKFVKQ